MQRDQGISEMADEILLARQAMALVRRSEEPLIETLEAILKTPAGPRPLEPWVVPTKKRSPSSLPRSNTTWTSRTPESDPDIVVLGRQDGSYAAAFSAIGATREGIVEAAREDYAALVEANAGRLASFSEKRHSA